MQHGTKVLVALLIVGVDSRINKNGLCTIETEVTPYNEKGIFQLTHKYLDNLAFKAGAANGDVLGNALATSMDDNFLHMEFMWVEAGQPIGTDGEGNAILSKDGNDKFTVSHFRTEQFVSIELGQDASDYVNELNKAIDMEDIREARKAKREAQGRSRTVRTATTVAKVDVVEDEEDEEESEGGAEMFSAPKTETKPKTKK